MWPCLFLPECATYQRLGFNIQTEYFTAVTLKWPTLEVWTCVFMTVTCFHDHLLHSYSLFPHQYIVTMSIMYNVYVCVIIIIIKSNDTGWVLFTRKVWRTLWVKKSCYDKNWIFIILNLHHDAPFNLSPAALAMPHIAARRCSIFSRD